jgi:hypothetical protein
MPFLLPPSTPLQTETPTALVWDGHQLVAQLVPTYPAVHVLDQDLPGNHYDGYSAVKMPVVLTPDGPVTDWEWKAFVDLYPHLPSRYNSSYREVESASLSKSIDGIRKGTLAWDLKCVAMPDYESLIGRLFEAYKERLGFLTANERQEDVQSDMKTPPATLFSRASRAQLQQFRDRGRSLTDLAASQGLWDMAEWLVEQGVGLTPAMVETGLVHQAMVLTCKSSASASNLNMFSLTNKEAWLDRWLTRLEGFPLPTGRLDWDRKNRDHRQSNSTGQPMYTDSVASFWAHKQVNWSGINPSQPHTLSKLDAALFKRWVQHWTVMGVDLDTVEMPTRFDAYNEKPPFTPLAEVWQDKLAPWLAAVQAIQSPLKRQRHLDASLPAPSPTKSKGPRF